MVDHVVEQADDNEGQGQPDLLCEPGKGLALLLQQAIAVEVESGVVYVQAGGGQSRQKKTAQDDARNTEFIFGCADGGRLMRHGETSVNLKYQYQYL